jgi:oligopeptidase B
MLDPTIPWTAWEFFEWGNPLMQSFFYYMRSYDPYGNIFKKDYPHLFVQSGILVIT